MSLKYFHIFFIFLAVLTCLGFGAWALLTQNLPASFSIMGWISVVSGVAFLVYGVYFVKKLRNIIT